MPDTPRKEQFSLSPSQPFALLSAKGLLREPVFHIHDCLEIDFVLCGSGTNYIGGEEYILRPGDVYLINNLQQHIAVSDGTLDMLILIFEPALLGGWPTLYESLAPFFAQGPGASRPSLTKEDRRAVAALFGEIRQECGAGVPGWQVAAGAGVLALLALLYRATGAGEGCEADVQRIQAGYSRIRPAVEHIDRCYGQPLHLAELAACCGLSHTYFAGLFRQVMGVTPGAYIEMVRISRACLLLATGDAAVTEIAFGCGYASLSSFNAAFKKRCGLTPGSYRRQHAGQTVKKSEDSAGLP